MRQDCACRVHGERPDEDRKAALWMYAWSFQSPARQRQEALEHILMLTAAERQTPGRLT